MKIKMELIKEALNEGYIGFCLACGEEAIGVEPDAHDYRCNECGEMKVFGAEEILIMGEVEDED